jgi:hypothetical protein
MEISPKLSIWLNIAYGLLTGLTTATVDALGFSGHETQIIAWAGIIAIVLNGVLHGFSNSTPGPLAPPDPAVVVAAQAVADAKGPSALADAKKEAIVAIQTH